MHAQSNVRGFRRIAATLAATLAVSMASAGRADDCAVIYDGAWAAKQSQTRVKVVQIPEGKLLCWRAKDFVKFGYPVRLDRQVVVLEKDSQGLPMLAGMPSPEATAPKSSIHFYAEMDAMPVVKVWFSPNPPASSVFSYEAGEQDTSLRKLVQRWTTFEEKQLVWRLPSDGKILNPLQFNATAKLHQAMWLDLGIEGINEALAANHLVDGLREPIRRCNFGSKVEVRPASIPCGKQW